MSSGVQSEYTLMFNIHCPRHWYSDHGHPFYHHDSSPTTIDLHIFHPPFCSFRSSVPFHPLLPFETVLSFDSSRDWETLRHLDSYIISNPYPMVEIATIHWIDSDSTFLAMRCVVTLSSEYAFPIQSDLVLCSNSMYSIQCIQQIKKCLKFKKYKKCKVQNISTYHLFNKNEIRKSKR